MISPVFLKTFTRNSIRSIFRLSVTYGCVTKTLNQSRWHVAPTDLERVISYAIKNLQDFSACQQLNIHVIISPLSLWQVKPHVLIFTPVYFIMNVSFIILLKLIDQDSL